MANYETTTISELDIPVVAERLGPDGPGFVVVENGLDPTTLAQINEELGQLDVPWSPCRKGNINGRGEPVQQVFDVFAHKLSLGPQEFMERMPAFHHLATLATHQLVTPLSQYFPSLKTWEVDELTTQRYPDTMGKLGMHRDLMRHPGVIITYSTAGEAILTIEFGSPPQKQQYHLRPGFEVVLRATNLYKPPFLQEKVLCNWHEVEVLQGQGSRTSITARSNDRPTEPIKNFTYHNWHPGAEIKQ